MVDISAARVGPGARRADQTTAVNRETLSFQVTAATDTTLESYARFAAAAIHAPPQHPLWIGSWRDCVNADVLIATISRGGKPLLALPLETVRIGPLGVARFPGGSHANGNFPPVHAEGAEPVGAAALQRLAREIARARPDIHALVLTRLLPALDGHANPLLALPASRTPEPLLAVDLDGGFDAVLGRTSAKRKRKKHRSQTRKFEEAGGFRHVDAATSAEALRLLEGFLAMKAERLHKMGVANVFAEPGIGDFFRRLFGEAAELGLPFRMQGLEVGGRLRAVTGSSFSRGRQVCEFGAIAEDELSHTSPGDFLFYENIRSACGAGNALFDFSVGDEPYKRLWCNLETWPMDVMLPLTAQGRLLALLLRLRARAVAAVKTNAVLWPALRRMRRRSSPRAEAETDD